MSLAVVDWLSESVAVWVKVKLPPLPSEPVSVLVDAEESDVVVVSDWLRGDGRLAEKLSTLLGLGERLVVTGWSVEQPSRHSGLVSARSPDRIAEEARSLGRSVCSAQITCERGWERTVLAIGSPG